MTHRNRAVRSHRGKKLACAIALSTLIAAGCGGGGGGGTGSTIATSTNALSGTFSGNTFSVADAIFENVTSSTMGPVTAVVLTTGADACSDVSSGRSVSNAQYLLFSLREIDGASLSGSGVTAPGVFTVIDPTVIPSPSTTANLATLSYEGDDSTCSALVTSSGASGTITIAQVSGSSLAGTFDIMMGNGDHVIGKFDASSCGALRNPNPNETCVDGGLLPLSTPTPIPTPTSTPTPQPTLPPTPSPTITLGAAPQGDQAVAFQINALHDGYSSTSGLSIPLTRAWTLDLAAPVSYPLIADGRIFVATSPSGTGSQLHALNRDTGATLWGPVDLGGTNGWSGLAYDGGKVFTLTFGGLLRAIDAASGSTIWAQQLSGQYAFSSAPTAAYGVVFVGGAGSGGTLYAVDELTGTVQWTGAVENGDDSAPVVTTTGVYASYACQQSFDFATTSGSPIWHHDSSCEGGGGATAVLHGDALYVRDFVLGNVVLDAATGAAVGGFTASAPPAFHDSRGFFLVGNTLEARDTTTNAVLWSAGDGSLGTSPVVANGTVYVGSAKSTILGFDESSGSLVWSDTLSQPVTGADNKVGLALGEGFLVVPAGTSLTAYH